MAAGVRRAGSTRSIELPLADGGEGTLDTLLAARGGSRRTARVTGPLGDPVDAEWGVLTGGIAIVEMAQASGLALVAGRNDPLRASTRGTGELIAAVRAQGFNRVVVAVGGSATTDGGLAAVEALGWSLQGMKVTVACDVETPFADAANVFGPQKGASDAQVALLTRRLQMLAEQYRHAHRRRRHAADGRGRGRRARGRARRDRRRARAGFRGRRRGGRARSRARGRRPRDHRRGKARRVEPRGQGRRRRARVGRRPRRRERRDHRRSGDRRRARRARRSRAACRCSRSPIACGSRARRTRAPRCSSRKRLSRRRETRSVRRHRDDRRTLAHLDRLRRRSCRRARRAAARRTAPSPRAAARRGATRWP